MNMKNMEGLDAHLEENLAKQGLTVKEINFTPAEAKQACDAYLTLVKALRSELGKLTFAQQVMVLSQIKDLVRDVEAASLYAVAKGMGNERVEL